jgi:thiol-disulfide isomerase/thioredoxin
MRQGKTAARAQARSAEDSHGHGWRARLLALTALLAAAMLWSWPAAGADGPPLKGRFADAFQMPDQPRPAPEASFTTRDGETVRLADFKGQVVLVNFWATWCAPCVREMPLLDRLDDEYGERLQVVGIAVDRPGAVRAFVERLGVDYPVLVGTDDVRATRDRFGNPGGMLPYTVLVDSAGVIRWRHLGELERGQVERALERLPGGRDR